MKAAKFLVGVITAIAVALSTMVGSDTTTGKVITVVLAAVGAIAVYLVPNGKPAVPPT